MTDGTEETITDPVEGPCKAYKKRRAKKTEGAEKEITTSKYSVESGSAIRAEKVAACSCKRIISISGTVGKSLKSSRQGSRFAAQEGVCDDQDTENECETETEQCGVDETQQCEETEQWFSEDDYRQRCEVKAGRDANMRCRILTVLGRKEWRTWNDVPLELRKDIERIHRNLGHTSADQLEKLFRDANVSDDAVPVIV